MTGWLRHQLETNRAMVRNSASLIGTTGVNMLLGFVYWWLAARLFPPASIGVASVAISTITLLGTMGTLGMGPLMMGELPRSPHRRGSTISSALLAASVGGAALGLLFALLLPHTSSDLRLLAAGWWSSALVVIGAGLTAASLVLDQAFLGLLRGELQLWRNAIFGVAKLVALAAAGWWWFGSDGHIVFGTWIAGLAACLLSFAGLAGLRGKDLGSFMPSRRLLSGLGRVALGHHALSVTLQITGLSMPLIVAALLSTTAVAYYFTAGMISSLAYVGPISLATILFAVGASEPHALAQRLRFGLGLSGALGVCAILALLVAGGHVLAAFGPSYAQEGTVPLLILSLGVFPIIVREHYAAIRRVYGRPAGGALVVLAGSALKLSLATVGARIDGLIGVAIGLLIAGCIEAAVMAPAVVRTALGGVPRWRGTPRDAARSTSPLPGERNEARTPVMESQSAQRPPRVSIGMPVHNGERYLREALDSILGQTYGQFELIISDNGSTDSTAAICHSYAAADPRIRYYRNDVNRGGAWNFNRVVSLARGEYFKWASHDDVCAPDFLQNCVDALDRLPPVVLCHPRSVIIDKDGTVVEHVGTRLRTDSPRASERFHDLIRIFHGCYQQSGLIRAESLRRTSLIGNYPASDRIFLARLALLGPFVELPDELFQSRRHDAQSLALTRFARAAWFDPAKAGQLVFPEWRLFFEHFNCARGIRLGASERALCYWHAARWPIWNHNWLAMGRDLVRAAVYAVTSGFREGQGRPAATPGHRCSPEAEVSDPGQ
jgi:glycosyltransferase involved in cell wall biosynthesis/O-antigen/teichoic acid export membrane protein